MNKRTLQLLTMLLVLKSAAFAQEGTSTYSLKTEKIQRENPFHLTMSLTVSSNLYKDGSPNREASTELLFNPSVELSKETSLAVKAVLTQEQTQAQNTLLSNTLISLSTKGPDFGTTESNFTLGGVAPTDPEERKTNHLQGGALLGTSLKNHWRMFNWTYGLSLTRNFHEYTVNAEGEPNIQYSLKNALELEAEINSKWSITTAGLYKKGWTYRNFQRDAFGFEMGVNYNLSKTLQVSAGFSNEGGALKANGQDSNIQIYDEKTTALKASVTFVN